jgi:AcrR family transcriptional regulator
MMNTLRAAEPLRKRNLAPAGRPRPPPASWRTRPLGADDVHPRPRRRTFEFVTGDNPTADRDPGSASAGSDEADLPLLPALRGTGPREAILRAAVVVFAEHGVAGTTVEDLLRQADVSRRTFYRFFGNKEEVLDALHLAATEALLASAREAGETATSPLDHLDRVLGAYLAFVLRGGRLLLVLQGEASREGSPLSTRRKAALASLTDLAHHALRAKLNKEVDRYLITGALLGAEGVARRLVEELTSADHRPMTARERDHRVARARKAMTTLLASSILGLPLPNLAETSTR